MEASGIEYGGLVEQGITQTTSFVDEMETVFAKGSKDSMLLIKNSVAALKRFLANDAAGKARMPYYIFFSFHAFYYFR